MAMRSEEDIRKLRDWFWDQAVQLIDGGVIPSGHELAYGMMVVGFDALSWALGEDRPIFADMICGLKSCDYLSQQDPKHDDV